MVNNNKKPMVKPAIIIGLGGTGNQIIRRLKKLVNEHYGDKPMLLNFLVVDTDQDTFNNTSWAQLPALSDLEELRLYSPQVPFTDVRHNPKAYPEIHEWLPATLDVGLLDRHGGAGQIRMLGRLALYKSFDYFARRLEFFFQQCREIKTRLAAMEEYDFDVETDPIVYLISSVCGGQGAGSFIDVAVAMRELTRDRFSKLNVIGILTLPSVYRPKLPRDNWSQVCANAHAAMKEVDYLMHNLDRSKTQFRFPLPIGRTIIPQEPLFDLCYLSDLGHRSGLLSNAEEVYDQIATQLFLEIGTPFGARSDSIRVNLSTVAGIKRDSVYDMGRRYSGFGNHTISFDREKILQLASFKSTYSAVYDTLLGRAMTSDEIEKVVTEFISRHRIDESQTDDLVNFLITGREVGQEQLTAGWAQERPNYETFANQLWIRLDAFLQRRAPDLRAQAERRARAKLEGADHQDGVLGNIDKMLDTRIRQSGVTAALNLVDALLAQIRIFEGLMRTEYQEYSSQARQFQQEADSAKVELINLARELESLQDREDHISLFSWMWKLMSIAITFGMWKPGARDEEERARQFHELTLRAQDQRNQLLNRFNQIIEQRLPAEARDVAASLYAETATRLLDYKDRLEHVKSSLEESSRLLREEMEKLSAEIKRTRYIGGNTMRRDVTTDYVDQYHQMYVTEATERVLDWLMPDGQPALVSLESHSDREQIRQKFTDFYKENILGHTQCNSLAEMIERFHTHNHGGSLTDRIAEGLQFCQPFWNICISGNQYPSDVLMVGMEQDHDGVDAFLKAHAVAQRGQVFPHIVTTRQDSVILLSRISHGAAYYWHAEDEVFLREYAEAIEKGPSPVHLNQAWRTLPEPVPDPSKYERRIFALGIAYEFIAVRGGAYYLDLERRHSLAGTSRQDKPDWQTIPLLEAKVLSGEPKSPTLPPAEDMLDDDNRTEAMQKFIINPQWVAAIRDKLAELPKSIGRAGMKEQVGEYCRKVLMSAIEELKDENPVRHQLEVELAELQGVMEEIEPAAGVLKLER